MRMCLSELHAPNHSQHRLHSHMTTRIGNAQEAGKQADTFILINASCVELPFVKDYVERMSPEGAPRRKGRPLLHNSMHVPKCRVGSRWPKQHLKRCLP